MEYHYNNKYKIIWSQNFKLEQKKIYNYTFFNLNEPLVVKELQSKIITSLYSLQTFPERYPKVEHYSSQKKLNIRKLLIENYVVLYEVDNDLRQVIILHIFHGTQNYFNLL